MNQDQTKAEAERIARRAVQDCDYENHNLDSLSIEQEQMLTESFTQALLEFQAKEVGELVEVLEMTIPHSLHALSCGRANSQTCTCHRARAAALIRKFKEGETK